MEYLKFVDVSQVIMPEPILKGPYPFPEDLLKVLDYYKKSGFLETFPAAYHKFGQPKNVELFEDLKDESKLYRILANNKPALYTYCYLRYGTKFSHVMVADFDEFPAFNITRYGNVMTAINNTINFHKRKFKQPLPSFVMNSFELMKCTSQPSLSTFTQLSPESQK